MNLLHFLSVELNQCNNATPKNSVAVFLRLQLKTAAVGVVLVLADWLIHSFDFAPAERPAIASLRKELDWQRNIYDKQLISLNFTAESNEHSGCRFPAKVSGWWTVPLSRPPETLIGRRVNATSSISLTRTWSGWRSGLQSAWSQGHSAGGAPAKETRGHGFSYLKKVFIQCLGETEQHSS